MPGPDAGAAQRTPRPPYRVGELTIEDGLSIAMWRTPGPWAVQDALVSPPPDEGYWAVRDAEDALIGFCCFGEAARAGGLAPEPGLLDVALGLTPELTGRRLSRDFAAVVVGRAREVAEERGLRCSVAMWNSAGRRTAEAVGFQVTGLHEATGASAAASYLIFEM